MGKQIGVSLPEWARDTEWGEIRIALKPDGEPTTLERMKDEKIRVEKTRKITESVNGKPKTEEHKYSLVFPEYELTVDSTLREAKIELQRRMNAGSKDSGFADDRPLIAKSITTTYLTAPDKRKYNTVWGREMNFKGCYGPTLDAVVELPEKAREVIAERRRQSRGE